MSKSPYKNYSGASEGVGIAGSAANAATPFPNPMGGVQNAQQAYHLHQYGKIVRPAQTFYIYTFPSFPLIFADFICPPLM